MKFNSVHFDDCASRRCMIDHNPFNRSINYQSEYEVFKGMYD